uniref:Uncharacterized protein n=1 Tax=Arundo donax TaxID=35708 RepID=A0A0A9A986_ARUDO
MPPYTMSTINPTLSEPAQAPEPPKLGIFQRIFLGYFQKSFLSAFLL